MSKESNKSMKTASTDNSIKFKGKIGGYSSAKLMARRDKKRDEATERQDWYNDLTTVQKIARVNTLIKKYPGESKKQLVKLNAALAIEKAAPKTAPVVTVAPTKVKKVAAKK